MYTTFGSFFAYLNQQQSLFVVDVVGENGSIQGSSFRYTLAISKAKIKHASFYEAFKTIRGPYKHQICGGKYAEITELYICWPAPTTLALTMLLG